MPNNIQDKAKVGLHEICMAILVPRPWSLLTYGARYPKAAETLVRGHEALLAFQGFPAGHWLAEGSQPDQADLRYRALPHHPHPQLYLARKHPGLAFKLVQKAKKELAPDSWRGLPC